MWGWSCLARLSEQRRGSKGCSRLPGTRGIDFGLYFCAEGDTTIRYSSLVGLSAELYYSYSGLKL